MKFFRAAAPGVVALVLCLCVVPAFASAAPDPDNADALETGEVLTDASDVPAPSGNDTEFPPDTDRGGSDYVFVADIGGSEYPSGEDSPGSTPVSSGTLPGFLRLMFGEYTPKTQIVTTYYNGQPIDVSIEYVPGVAGMDMEWLASVILFGVVVYCLFRMLGGMVR